MITYKSIRGLFTIAFIILVLAGVSTVYSASMSASLGEPVIDDADIANLTGAIGTDKWWVESGWVGYPKGQTFTTGIEPVWVKSISYQISDGQKAEPTKTYIMRLGTIYGSAFTEIHSETATQGFTWNASEFMTWTFETPILLAPFTEYGIDVGLTSSTSGWRTGIPYIQNTSNNYSGGSSYVSGTEGRGIGDNTLNKSTNDRIFHIDLTTADPTMPGYAWPQTGETVDAGNIELTWTNLLPNTGSDVWTDVWFGTDPDADFNKIVNAGLNQTSVVVDATADARYYWQVNTYLDGSSSGSPAQGQLFTFYVDETAEPNTISALNALENHILGSPLTDTEIAAHKATIDTNKSLFGTSQGVISAALDLVATYDANPGDGSFGPLWIDSHPPSRDNLGDDFVSTMYYVMQHIFDTTYTKHNLALNEALLDGFKFGSSAVFPGSVDPPAVIETHTATINASYPDTAGWERQGDTLAARKPTGTYLAPGTIVTVTVPPELVKSGYMIRVGAHSWDLSHRPWVKRLDRSSIVYPIESTQVKVANPLGGGIYIEVPYRADNGVVNVDITGAVRSPFYSYNTVTGHITTLQDWQNIERNYPAPWADFQTEKYMTQVPTSYIYALDDPVTAMNNWDMAIDTFNDLMGFPRDRGKETIYTQVDVIMRSGVHAPGYPAVNTTNGNPTADVHGGNSGTYLVHGPKASAHIEIHEHAHAYFFPKFGGERESTVNLPHAAIMNQTFGYDFDDSLAASFGYYGNPHRTLNNTAVAWMCSFNFSPREVEMHSAEKSYQLKGHAKFVDIAKMFGWQVLNDFWKSFVDDYEATGSTNEGDDDDKLLRLSKAVGVDIRPLFHFWGIHPSDPNALKTAIQTEGLKPSLEIYNRLLEYKSVLPNNNAEFQTYCLNWWGRQPNPNGYWTESEHARQWDATELWEGENDVQQRSDITVGEMYTEAVAADIREYIDRIIEKYFPNGSPAYSLELPDMVSWSGESMVMDPNITNNTVNTLNYSWDSLPAEGVSFDAKNIENPIVTITKPTGDAAVYTLSLTIDDGVTPPVTDTMTVEVYDDSCQAARLGLGLTERADINKDCAVDLIDFYSLAKAWLEIHGLQEPQHKIEN